MTPIHRRFPRGFTLIELMIVVSIVGMLSTVALPVYRRATLRVRTAERGTILTSMRIGIEDAYVHGKVPAPPANLHGIPNPAGVAGPAKRHFVPGAAGWPDIGVVIEGNCFYTYEYLAVESGTGAGAGNAQFSFSATGDLDGDGNTSAKQLGATRIAGRFVEWAPVPPDGEEDLLTY